MDMTSNVSLQYKIAGLFLNPRDAIGQLDDSSLKEEPVIRALAALTLNRDMVVSEAAKKKLEGVYSQA